MKQLRGRRKGSRSLHLSISATDGYSAENRPVGVGDRPAQCRAAQEVDCTLSCRVGSWGGFYGGGQHRTGSCP